MYGVSLAFIAFEWNLIQLSVSNTIYFLLTILCLHDSLTVGYDTVNTSKLVKSVAVVEKRGLLIVLYISYIMQHIWFMFKIFWKWNILNEVLLGS
jgi:hypothetical protein